MGLVVTSIDELYFPWEKAERKRERQRRTASIPKCLGCNQRTRNGYCPACQRERAEAKRQRDLDAVLEALRCGVCGQTRDAMTGYCFTCHPF